MRRILLAGLIAMLAACQTPAAAPPPPPVVQAPPLNKEPVTGRLTAPAGADVAIDAPKGGPVSVDLRAADQGKTVPVRRGDRISVSLVGTPTAGYLWAAANPPAFLKLVGETSGPTHSDQLKPGFTGGDHWEVTTYTVTAPGHGVLRFEQRRPWESRVEPPVNTWSVTLDAK